MRFKYFNKKIIIIISSFVFLAVACILILANLGPSKDIAFVSNMKTGWNLGNTLDVHGLDNTEAEPEKYETYWGNPITTKEMIREVKEAGFHTIRIPVTWYAHMDESCQIDDTWMDRVQQVVDYGIENGLYVILNAHHDAWYTPSASNQQNAMTVMRRVWEQIAERFADYDEHLLFEGMNEPRLIGTEHEWDEGSPEAREIVNKLNAVFVETVRSCGKKNAERYLLIPTYCASTKPVALEALRLPKSGRLIISIHLYRPYEFALSEDGTSSWNEKKPEDTGEIDQAIEDAHRLFISKGIPVIITEFGAIDKNNTENRAEWTHYIIEKASSANIACIWWDDSIFDRRTLEWRYPAILNALVQR